MSYSICAARTKHIDEVGVHESRVCDNLNVFGRFAVGERIAWSQALTQLQINLVDFLLKKMAGMKLITKSSSSVPVPVPNLQVLPHSAYKDVENQQR